jgi:hypothetical protein
MIFKLFKSKPILDDDTVHWLFDAYAWALNNFDAGVFFHETILVTPSNEHFPGRISSAEGMAAVVFERVKEYAGLRHWPFQLVDPNMPVPDAPPKISIEGALRGAKGIVPGATNEAQRLPVPYNLHQVAKPEALIAGYAHILAYYLGTMAKERPPGGEEFWPHTTELLAVFMGFGLMLANTAYTFKGGCGSCYNPLAERSAFLSQDEVTYALAIFCVLKEIPQGQVLNHLKKYLRPVFKAAVKEINERQRELDRLRGIHSNQPANALTT